MDSLEQAREALDRKALDAAIIAVEERGYAHFGGEIEAAIKAYLAALSRPVEGVKGNEKRCAICGGPRDNGLLSDICAGCETDAPWQEGATTPPVSSVEGVKGEPVAALERLVALAEDYERAIRALGGEVVDAYGDMDFARTALTGSAAPPVADSEAQPYAYTWIGRNEDERHRGFGRNHPGHPADSPYIVEPLYKRAGSEALRERVAENERLRFEGDLDKWVKIIGAGTTGHQPEAYAVMDAACHELVALRAEARLAQAERGPAVTEAMVERGIDAYRQLRRDGISNFNDIARDIIEAALHPQSAAGEEGKTDAG